MPATIRERILVAVGSFGKEFVAFAGLSEGELSAAIAAGQAVVVVVVDIAMLRADVHAVTAATSLLLVEQVYQAAQRAEEDFFVIAFAGLNQVAASGFECVTHP